MLDTSAAIGSAAASSAKMLRNGCKDVKAAIYPLILHEIAAKIPCTSSRIVSETFVNIDAIDACNCQNSCSISRQTSFYFH